MAVIAGGCQPVPLGMPRVPAGLGARSLQIISNPCLLADDDSRYTVGQQSDAFPGTGPVPPVDVRRSVATGRFHLSSSFPALCLHMLETRTGHSLLPDLLDLLLIIIIILRKRMLSSKTGILLPWRLLINVHQPAPRLLEMQAMKINLPGSRRKYPILA